MSIEFGVDYYPEHWESSRLETDAALMKELGIDVVRMGEFSWFKFEPEIGNFDFDWLDHAIDVLSKYGIKSVIGTPTAAPPRWIIESDPSILPIDLNGTTRGFGGRHHDCQSNKNYRSHCSRIVTAMADHYSTNPNVIGWQIDNELGNSHDNLCTCDSCRDSFHSWLEKRYCSIEALNEAWGTSFWSQNYTQFSQIPVPRITPTSHNPSLLLDWKRFCSDLIVDFAQLQISILRKKCPHQFITHNFMGFAEKVNYFDLGSSLDFVSQDQYPQVHWLTKAEKMPSVLAGTLDFIRGVKQQNYWIMEQQAGPAGWELIGQTPRPGQLALWTAQAVAHGADAVVFFRWRTCTFGTEEYWHGVLPHNGIPGRRYEEIKKAITALKPVMKNIKGLCTKSETAILYDYDQKWALRIQPHSPKLHYAASVLQFYEAFYDKNIPVDFIDSRKDFSRYKLITAPLQFILDFNMEEKLKKFVAEGGILIATMRSGVKTISNTCRTDGSLPCGLADMLGIEVNDYDSLHDFDVPVTWLPSGEDSDEDKGLWWSDILSVHEETEVLAIYNGEYYKGTPAVTAHKYKKGTAYYAAVQPSRSLMHKIIDHAVKTANIKGLLNTPEGIEVTHRNGSDADYFFVMNHSNIESKIEIPDSWNHSTGHFTGYIEPYGFEVFMKKR